MSDFFYKELLIKMFGEPSVKEGFVIYKN